MEDTFSISFSRSAQEEMSKTDPVTLSLNFSHSCKQLLPSVSFRAHIYGSPKPS